MTHTEIFGILILSFLTLTFLHSGYEKVAEWKENVAWLKEHFKSTLIRNQVPAALGFLLITEVIAGAFCATGIIQIVATGATTIGYYGAVMSCITLLLMLFGQRLAKDYDGARNIAIYYILAILAVSWLG
ncbi:MULTISPECIES: DoxX family protein [Flavobacterium]|uniref:DoxX family protein n=1 Tax=Flavobacterium TaxID=237 RepID=UPI001FCBCEBA|nr:MULTISPECIES: DoxX family protein [Flavobacterium]UOK43122.1 DoxX family protein [Flavobacterium enshiense]